MRYLERQYVNKLLYGRCEKHLIRIPSESIDMMATDPPYGISFMGKDWDKVLPSVNVWKQCYRVLKPGSWVFVMSIPRQDCMARMILNLEDAGFEINYTPLFHVYATGFPKAANVSKLIEKRMGEKGEVVGRYTSPDGYDRDWEGNSVNRDVYGWASQEQGTNTRSIIEPTSDEAKALNGSYIGFQVKPALEAILVASKPISDKYRRSDVYRILRGKRDYWYTSYKEITKKNREAQEKRWGFYLKPGDVVETRLALNPTLEDETIISRRWVMKSKPYKDTDLTSGVTKALATGKGITWLDSGRIPYDSNGDKPSNCISGGSSGLGEIIKGHKFESSTIGRFPANLLVSEDMLNDGRILPGSSTGKTIGRGTGEKDRYGWATSEVRSRYPDSGSFSRYFDLDKWAEVNLPPEVFKTYPCLLVPKPSKSEKNVGLDKLPDKQIMGGGGLGLSSVELRKAATAYGSVKAKQKNTHPTCKPIKLMSYMIAIGSREGDIVLDPYMGSGTTPISAKIMGRRYVGIEMEADSMITARMRIRAYSEGEEGYEIR